MLWKLEHLAEEAFSSPRVSFCAQHEVDCLAGGIDRVVEVAPSTFDFDIGFIDSIGVIG